MSAPTPAMVEAGAKAARMILPFNSDLYVEEVAEAVWQAMSAAAEADRPDPRAAHALALAEEERTRRALEDHQARVRGEAIVRLLEHADPERWHRCLAQVAAMAAQAAERLP